MTTDTSHNNSYITSIKQFVAGGVGGVCLILAGHPMDTIKVRLQTMPTPKPGEKPQYRGMLDCIAKTVRREGLLGFYKGMAAPLIGATPVNSFCFWGYGLGVSLQTGGNPTDVSGLTPTQLFKAGMLSGFCTALINAPTERIKCLLQVQQASKSEAKYKGFADCARQVFANGGISSLYRGLLATFTRDIPGSGAYFLCYEMLRRESAQLFGTENKSAVTLLAGGTAGIAYWIVGIPADVIKSKIQTAPDGKYDGFRDAIRTMYAKQGIMAFYRGAGPVFIRAFPANAACFFGYEYSMQLLNVLIP